MGVGVGLGVLVSVGLGVTVFVGVGAGAGAVPLRPTATAMSPPTKRTDAAITRVMTSLRLRLSGAGGKFILVRLRVECVDC